MAELRQRAATPDTGIPRPSIPWKSPLPRPRTARLVPPLRPHPRPRPQPPPRLKAPHLHVVLSSPAAVREAFKDHDEALANHEPPAAIADALRHDMLWCPHGQLWRALRKVTVRELLSVSGIEAVNHLRCREVRCAVSGLRAGEPVDVRDLVFTTVFHVMTGVGSDARRVGDDTASEFRKVIEEVVWPLSVSQCQMCRTSFRRLRPALDLQGLSRRMKELYKRYTELFAKFAEEKDDDADSGGR